MSGIKTLLFIFLSSVYLTASAVGNTSILSIDGLPTNSVSFNYVEGLIIVEASINGDIGNYIFDTGAPRLIVNEPVEQGEFTLWMVGNELQGKHAYIDEFQFGGQIKDNICAWAADLSFLENIVRLPLAGIIGGELFSNHQIYLDYELGAIQLISDKRLNLNIPVRSYNISTLTFEHSIGNLPIVDIMIGSESRSMIFDTGANISVLNKNLDSPGILTEQFMADVKIKNMRIKDMQFMHESLALLNVPNSIAIDGILSVSSLNSSKVLIDFESSKIHIMWLK